MLVVWHVRYEETVNSLIPLIRTLTGDSEWVVRQNVGEQLGGVAQVTIWGTLFMYDPRFVVEIFKLMSDTPPIWVLVLVLQFCLNQGGESGYRLLIEVLLPQLAKLLGDRQEEVSEVDKMNSL